jgi:hypothetical protein
MWRIAGSVILVLGGLFLMYLTARSGYATAVAPGFIALVVGLGQWIWGKRWWLIAGSIVLILYGGFWILFWFGMGVMLFDNPGTTVGEYLNGVIPIAAPGLIALIAGVGQLIEFIRMFDWT